MEENVCLRTDDVWEPSLEVSATNFETALHMGVADHSLGQAAKGWDRNNKYRALGEPLKSNSGFIGTGLRAVSLCASARNSVLRSTTVRLMCGSQTGSTQGTAEEAPSSSVKQEPPVIRQNQMRMRRSKLKRQQDERKMEMDPLPGFLTCWANENHPCWMEVLSKGNWHIGGAQPMLVPIPYILPPRNRPELSFRSALPFPVLGLGRFKTRRGKIKNYCSGGKGEDGLGWGEVENNSVGVQSYLTKLRA